MNRSPGLSIPVKPTPPTITDLTDRKFNRWTCLGYAEKREALHFWWFECECGTVEKKHAGHIVAGRSTSCGCVHSEELSRRNTTHGQSRSREHQIWKAMHQRCRNVNHIQYADYGGRGIRVCSRWSGPDGFAHFLKDMGKIPPGCSSIERKRNNENYSPSNCRWATQKEQNRNKRNNLMITFNGKTQCLAAWAEEIGIAQGCLYHRLVTANPPWPVKVALTTPSRAR